MPNLYMFDKDDTLTYTESGWPANTVGEQRLLPGVKDKLDALRLDDHYVGIITNQGGVSRGNLTPTTFSHIMNELNGLLEFSIPYKAAFFAPNQKYSELYEDSPHIRKPDPSMLLLMYQDVLRSWGMPKKIYFIGNAFTDEMAAEAACQEGMYTEFIWAHKFFGFKTIGKDSHGYKYHKTELDTPIDPEKYRALLRDITNKG